MMINSKLKFSEYMLNISRSNVFGKFVLIVPLAFFALLMTQHNRVKAFMNYLHSKSNNFSILPKLYRYLKYYKNILN